MVWPQVMSIYKKIIHSKNKKWIFGAFLFLVVSAALYYLVIAFYIIFSRISYPFSLEWMEGTSYIQVYRILQGRSLYLEPSLDYVPLIYPPLYYYVAAISSKIFGLSFFSIRIVSFLSTIGCFILIGLIVKKLNGSLLSAFLAIGLFAATFRLGGGWFDVARVDMFAILFFGIAIYLSLFDSINYNVAAGFAIAAGCLVKQSFLPVLVLLTIYYVLVKRKYALVAAVVALLSYSFLTFWLSRSTRGWYWFYVFDLPGGHLSWLGFQSVVKIAYSLYEFVVRLVITIPAFLGGPIVSLYFLWKSKNFLRFNLLFSVLAGAMVISWSGFLNPGGYDNVLLPSLFVLSIMTGLGVDKILENSRESQFFFLQVFTLSVILFQFIILRYPVREQIPTQSDREAGNSLLGELQNWDGEVYVPFHTELSVMAGKSPYASWVAMMELDDEFGGGSKREWRRVRFQLLKALENRKFKMIILDRNWLWGHPEQYYRYSYDLFLSKPDVFWPVTGWQIRPTIKLVPNE